MSKIIDSKAYFRKNAKRCPICGKTTLSSPGSPFCSARCRDIDLSHWMTESYYTSTDYIDESITHANDDTDSEQ